MPSQQLRDRGGRRRTNARRRCSPTRRRACSPKGWPGKAGAPRSAAPSAAASCIVRGAPAGCRHVPGADLAGNVEAKCVPDDFAVEGVRVRLLALEAARTCAHSPVSRAGSGPRRSRREECSSQKTRPHIRQWWRRRREGLPTAGGAQWVHAHPRPSALTGGLACLQKNLLVVRLLAKYSSGSQSTVVIHEQGSTGVD